MIVSEVARPVALRCRKVTTHGQRRQLEGDDLGSRSSVAAQFSVGSVHLPSGSERANADCSDLADHPVQIATCRTSEGEGGNPRGLPLAGKPRAAGRLAAIVAHTLGAAPATIEPVLLTLRSLQPSETRSRDAPPVR